WRRLVTEWNLHVDQGPGLIQKRRRVLVAQSKIDRHLRVDLPRIVNVVGLAHRPELDLRKRDRPLIEPGVAEQKLGEPVSSAGHRGASGSVGQASRHIRRELELAAREQVAQLVVLVPTQFATESE